MRSFIASCVVFAVLVTLTGLASTSFRVWSSEAYSLDSARVGHDGAVPARPGFILSE